MTSIHSRTTDHCPQGLPKLPLTQTLLSTMNHTLSGESSGDGRREWITLMEHLSVQF